MQVCEVGGLFCTGSLGEDAGLGVAVLSWFLDCIIAALQVALGSSVVVAAASVVVVAASQLPYFISFVYKLKRPYVVFTC